MVNEEIVAQTQIPYEVDSRIFINLLLQDNMHASKYKSETHCSVIFHKVSKTGWVPSRSRHISFSEVPTFLLLITAPILFPKRENQITINIRTFKYHKLVLPVFKFYINRSRLTHYFVSDCYCSVMNNIVQFFPVLHISK